MKLGGRATYVHLDSSKNLGERTPHGASISFIRLTLVVWSTCEVTSTLPSFNMIGSSVYHSHMKAAKISPCRPRRRHRLIADAGFRAPSPRRPRRRRYWGVTPMPPCTRSPIDLAIPDPTTTPPRASSPSPTPSVLLRLRRRHHELLRPNPDAAARFLAVRPTGDLDADPDAAAYAARAPPSSSRPAPPVCSPYCELVLVLV